MIRVDDVSKSYGSLKVLEHFSLEIPSGQTTVLIGPSGCGKTTLMEMMNGLISPDSGTIYVGGKDIASEDPVNLRRRIGYVIQEVGLFPHYTVYENIALIPRLLKWEESRIRKRVEELIHLVHIPVDRLDKYPHQLSGGQQQRIGVARALAADPNILLLDEPFSALDPITREHLQDEFSEIQARLHKTVVFVTHDMNEALKMGDQIAIMNQGRLIQYDSPVKLLTEPRNEFVKDFVGGFRNYKSLRFLNVGEVMKPADETVVLIEESTSQQEMRKQFRSARREYIFVTDSDKKFQGYYTAEMMNASTEMVPEQINRLHPLQNLQTALESLLAAPIPLLPVVDDENKLCGIVSLNDIQQMISRKTRTTRRASET